MTKSHKNKHAFAFSEITKPATEQSIQDYLKSIQSQLIQEENKKRDDDPKFSELETGHFQQFLWQVFMKGFDSYIQQSEFAYLGKPENLINTNNQNNAEQSYQRNKLAYNYIDHIHVKHEKISVNSGGQIAFWTLCKMLDAKHLNELLNQMTKWQQATGKLNLPINKQIKPYQQIIQLCLLSVDRISGDWQDHYDGKKEHYFSTLKPYLAGNVDHQHLFSLKSVFAQQDGSPIVIAPVEMAKKYATENIIKQVIDKKIDFKLSQQNITDWQKQKEDQSNDSPANLAKKRQELHLDWTKNKKKDLKNWLKTNNQNYKNICEQLEQCNWLDNKVHLIHIHRLHHLLMDILGRMAGFVALFDRDFQFLDLGCTQYRQNDDLQLDAFINFREAIDQINAKGLNNEGEIKVDKLENIYHRKHLKFLSDLFPTLSINEQAEVQMQMETKQEFYKTHFFEPSFKVFQKRNSIAHFNYLGKLECSILTYLADLRKLVGYDRKLKNAVAKSFIDLLDKHGIEIKLKLSHLPNNKIEIDVDEKDGKPKIKSKQISHLGGAVKIDQHPQEYIEMVRALLELGEKP